MISPSSHGDAQDPQDPLPELAELAEPVPDELQRGVQVVIWRKKMGCFGWDFTGEFMGFILW
jgi:hypothetical protein